MHPPLHRVGAAGTAESRAADGSPDIGAFEAGAGGGIPPGNTSGGSGGCLIVLLLKG